MSREELTPHSPQIDLDEHSLPAAQGGLVDANPTVSHETPHERNSEALAPEPGTFLTSAPGGADAPELGLGASSILASSSNMVASVVQRTAKMNDPQGRRPFDTKLKVALDRNRAVRHELQSMVQATEETLTRDRPRPRPANRSIPRKSPPKDPSLLQQCRATQEQTLRVSQLKDKVAKLTHELESTFCLREIKEKEDLLRSLKREQIILQVEKSSLEKIYNDYSRSNSAPSDHSSNTTHGQIGSTHPNVSQEPLEDTLFRKLKSLTSQFQDLVRSKAEREKEIASVHSQVLANKKFLNELLKRVEENKQIMNKPADSKDPDASPAENLTQLEQELEKENKKMADLTREGDERLKQMEKSRKEVTGAVEALLSLIKEKDKENKTGEIKLRELKRLHRHNLLKPMDNDGSPNNSRLPAGPDSSSAAKENNP